MINKLYEIIKNILSFLKNILVKILNSRIITVIDIILIILIFVSLFVELPYGEYMPGGATSVISHLDNVKYKTKGDIATTHVSYIGGDILSIIGGIFMPDWDIIKTDDIKYSHEDLIDAEKRGRIEMFSSASVATVIAYEKANVELNITSEDYYVTFITD